MTTVGWTLAGWCLACAPTPKPTSAPRSSSEAPSPDGNVQPTAVATTWVASREAAIDSLCRTLSELDRDCDKRITVEDRALPNCPSEASCEPPDGGLPTFGTSFGDVALSLNRTYEAAQFVQEVVLGLNTDEEPIAIDASQVRADPASYLLRRIDEHFWAGLTRRIGPTGETLLQAVADEKMGDGQTQTMPWCRGRVPHCEAKTSSHATTGEHTRDPTHYLYLPHDDERARQAFANASLPQQLLVETLPKKVNTDWVARTTRAGKHGLLMLDLDENLRGRPFVVPGGRFNEMYGWDSFFITWGLVQSTGKLALARSMVSNQVYEIEHYGKILNANRSYYLTRSQPPLLSSMIDQVWQRLPHEKAERDWLERSLEAAIAEYEQVWNAPPRRTSVCRGAVCLARYFGEGRGQPPEVEAGHFAWFYQSHALEHGHCPLPSTQPESVHRFVACSEKLARDYRSGKLVDAAIDTFFENDRCVRESGHDTTYRWFVDGQERCAAHATVDLNALLFKYELDLARLLESAFGGRLGKHTSAQFCERAQLRAELIERYLWDEQRGAYFDYDLSRQQRSTYLSSTTLYPLWASAPSPCNVSLVDATRAARLRDATLPELEAAGGLMATSPKSLERIEPPRIWKNDGSGRFVHRAVGGDGGRQWEAPNGWAPHQMLAWEGLERWSLESDAQRLRYRWLFTIVENAANYHGTVPEKFDVVARSHRVFAEYGNVNTDFAYITDEGFGWMNASFVVGYAALSPELRRALRQRIPPETLFDNAGN